jgi:hypothetical protein
MGHPGFINGSRVGHQAEVKLRVIRDIQFMFYKIFCKGLNDFKVR